MKTIESKSPPVSELSSSAAPAHAKAERDGAPGVSAGKADSPAHVEALAAPAQVQTPAATPPARSRRKWLWLAGSMAALALAAYFGISWVDTLLNTVSTDDAYVNGHVTLAAPRVPGKVAQVLVDDNHRVKKGDLLVQLDKEPFEVQVALKRAAVQVAEANVVAAEAKARSLEALLGSQRFKLNSAREQVDAQVAALSAKVATLRAQEATLKRTSADFERTRRSFDKAASSREEYDQRQNQLRVAESSVEGALKEVQQIRVALGLPAEPESGKSLTDVPKDLNQTFSGVRAAMSDCMQTVTELGLPLWPVDLTPDQALEKFRRLHKEGNIDKILRDLIPKVPAVMQAKAALASARHDLEQAELNLSYCDIVSDIDGVVTGRNINPGNYVQIGQQLMALRSVTEIWIDANFKETQLADLRIGQRVKCEVDMYGGRREFEGRITGFTMGTGQTLALLPPQNATGNFVKIVQRLPVRIELTDYDPEQAPLFIGLSVTPYVYYNEAPAGPDAGHVLQPWKR